MKVLAIIPARSGSKGLPNKNIKDMCGKPLLAYSIMAAKEAGIFEEIMVSTDSEEYATIAKQYGAQVPFLRDKTTSDDSASSWDAVREVLAEYSDIGRTFDAVCLLQPTSPLRRACDIAEAYRLFTESIDTVISVCLCEHSPLHCNRLPESRSLEGFIDPSLLLPRQALEGEGVFYRVNGAIYIVSTAKILTKANLYDKNSVAYIMEKQHSIDIDDMFDFTIAEALIKNT